MTGILPHLQRLVRRLGFQIAFLLAVALLPLSFISILTATNAARDVRARSEQALIGVTMTAISSEVSLIQRAQGMASTLALTLNGTNCGDLLPRLTQQFPEYSLIASIGTAGDLRCSSVPLTYNCTADPVFMAAINSTTPTVSVSRVGPVTKGSILLIAMPVTDSAGQPSGVIAVSLPLSRLQPAKNQGELKILTFDRDGKVLTASGGILFRRAAFSSTLVTSSGHRNGAMAPASTTRASRASVAAVRSSSKHHAIVTEQSRTKLIDALQP